MLFNSYFFIFVFLPLSVLGYFALNRLTRPRYANYFLLAMSLWFYGANDLRSLPVLLISIVLNYLIGSAILTSPYRRTKTALLVCGVLVNLGALGIFKYLNFFLSNLSLLLGQSYDPIHLLLPLGISFFTFQQISTRCSRPSSPMLRAVRLRSTPKFCRRFGMTANASRLPAICPAV